MSEFPKLLLSPLSSHCQCPEPGLVRLPGSQAARPANCKLQAGKLPVEGERVKTQAS